MEEKSIVKIYNGVIVNDLSRIDISRYHPKNEPKELNKANTIIIKTANLTLYIKLPQNKDFSKMEFHASVWKLLDFLMIKFTEKNSHECPKEKLKLKIEVLISEYIDLRSDGPISDSAKKKLIKEAKEDLFLLSCMSIEGKEQRKKEEKKLSQTLICTAAESKNGVITFCFSENLADYLVKSFPAQYPTSLMKLDSRNSNVYPLGRKLAIHHSIKNNQSKKTNKKIKVQYLLPWCPSLPSDVEKFKKDRHLRRRIYEPFEKSLMELGFGCVLKDSKGEMLEYNPDQTVKFAAYRELYVHFSIPSENN